MNAFKVGPTKFGNKGVLNLHYYADGSLTIQVLSDDDIMEPMYKATIYLDTPPADGCVWLKGWSENEGVPDAFVKAGLGTLTGRVCATGFVEAPEFKLNDELTKAYNQMKGN